MKYDIYYAAIEMNILMLDYTVSSTFYRSFLLLIGHMYTKIFYIDHFSYLYDQLNSALNI